jgi:hypothetical protein
VPASYSLWLYRQIRGAKAIFGLDGQAMTEGDSQFAELG